MPVSSSTNVRTYKIQPKALRKTFHTLSGEFLDAGIGSRILPIPPKRVSIESGGEGSIPSSHLLSNGLDSPQACSKFCLQPIVAVSWSSTSDKSKQLDENILKVPIDSSQFSRRVSCSSLSPRSVAGIESLPNFPQTPLPAKNQPHFSTVTEAKIVSPFDSHSSASRLNKFVRRLHDMLLAEKDRGVVEWRRGLLVLQSTDAFAKELLPKYFYTCNFKTFRRQLNYYGFVHVRSFSSTGTSTTALWLNRDLAEAANNDDIKSVLLLKRVEANELSKTVEGRRERKELAISTVEDLGVSSKTLQIQQIKMMAALATSTPLSGNQCNTFQDSSPLPSVIQCPSISPYKSCITPESFSTFKTKNEGLAAMRDVNPNSKEYSSSSDERACAANLLLMLSKTC